jgi:hypothetical protein
VNGFDGFNGGNDPFSKFWSEFMAKSPFASMATPSPSARDDMLKQMRRAFFDSWAKACDEFLGSPQFLDMMKKSMDNALAFKQQMNEFMTRAVHESQIPARTDTDSILLVLRSMEERVLGRLDALGERVADLEEQVEAAPGEDKPATSPKRKPAKR